MEKIELIKSNDNKNLYQIKKKSENKIIGNIQIMQNISKEELRRKGHIQLTLKDEEKNNGYESEIMKLVLIECKLLKIKKVLVVTNKEDKAWIKAIKENEGELEEEIKDEGKIYQRYGISLKKRPADGRTVKNILKSTFKVIHIQEERFQGSVALLEIKQVEKDWYVEEYKRRCILADGYYWLQFYLKNKNYCITAMYNDKKKIVEWYIDIARKIGEENGIPYQDDLYLDVVILPTGQTILLDEEELQEAYEKLEVTQKEYEMAYEITNKIIKQAKEKLEELKKISDDYLKMLLES